MPSDYKDEDLVYVDPRKRAVVGIVEWSADGNPKKLEMESTEKIDDDDDDGKEKGKGKGGRMPRKRKDITLGERIKA